MTSLTDPQNIVPTSTDSNTPRQDLSRLGSMIWSLAWKTLPVVSFGATFLFWKYVQLIGRPDLFLPSLSNVAGLGTFLFGFLALVGFTIFCLALPSLYFGTVLTGRGENLDELIARLMPWTLIRLSVGVLFGLSLSFNQLKSGIPIGLLVGVVLNAVWLFAKNRDDLAQIIGGDRDSLWYRFRWAAFYMVTLFFGGFVLTIPLAFLLKMFSFSDGEWWSLVFAFLVLGSVSLSTLIPAMIFFATRAKGRTNVRSIIASIVGLIFLAYLFFFVFAPSTTERLLEVAASEVGIRNESVFTYRIVSNRFGTEVFEQQLWGTAETGSAFSVVAISPISLGDLTMLCPKTLGDSESLRTKAATECVVFKRDEVVRVPVHSGREEIL